MNLTVQRIVALLLGVLTACGMFPAALATDIGPEDTTTDPTTLPVEEVPVTTTVDTTPTQESEQVLDPTEAPTTTESSETTTATEVTEATEPSEPIATEEHTVPGVTVPYLEEAVTGTVFSFGEQNSERTPMLRAVSPMARATLTGTQYQRAFVWLNGVDPIHFTYKGIDYEIDCLGLHSVYSNGTEYMAYCIDPGVNTNNSYGGYTGSETTWSSLSIDEQTAIGLAVLYGAPNGMYSTDLKTMLTYEFATQLIIDELRLGYRSYLPPYQCSNEVLIKNFGTNADGTRDDPYGRYITSMDVYAPISDTYMDRALLRSAYDTIASNLANHYVLPSFASRYNAAAKTYEMTKQSDGTYSVTLTDTNNILSKCSFTDGNGLTYEVNGDKLTITSQEAFDTVKSCAMTDDGGVAKSVPNLDKQVFYVWSAGSKQRLVSLAEAANDPLPLYINVTAPEQSGAAKIIKTLSNPEAGSVEGWSFKIADADGKEIGTFKTDSNGLIETDLEPGTYTVTEVLEKDSLWQCTTDNPQTITVEAGETAEVTFNNALRPAKITVYKVDPFGAPLADAEFLLEWSENGTDWKAVTKTTSQYVVKGGCTSADLIGGKLTSGRDGVVSFAGLYPNVQYRLTETKAPDGYNLQTSVIYQEQINVQENLTVEKTVVNSRPFELPMTGSAESIILLIAQLASVFALSTMLLYHVKKQW